MKIDKPRDEAAKETIIFLLGETSPHIYFSEEHCVMSNSYESTDENPQ